MTALAEFVAARLDEDEAMAKAAIEIGLKRYGDRYHEEVGFDPGGMSADDGWLVVDPARVLREAAATRTMVGEYGKLLARTEANEAAAAELRADIEHEERTGRWEGPGHPGTRGRAIQREADYLDAMRTLLRRLLSDRAAVWRDHPDYDEARRP